MGLGGGVGGLAPSHPVPQLFSFVVFGGETLKVKL